MPLLPIVSISLRTDRGNDTAQDGGTGLELDNIGPYQWGDDIRHMDGFATARTGRPQVKRFRYDVQQTIIPVHAILGIRAELFLSLGKTDSQDRMDQGSFYRDEVGER